MPFSIRLPRAEREEVCVGRTEYASWNHLQSPKGLSLQDFSEVDEAPVQSEYREFLGAEEVLLMQTIPSVYPEVGRTAERR